VLAMDPARVPTTARHAAIQDVEPTPEFARFINKKISRTSCMRSAKAFFLLL
jgi:hypothetical protein